MENVDWDKGLPLDLLSAVAGGRNELKAMRGVSRTWKAGYEASITKFVVLRSGPILPPGGAFAARFPAARIVHLAGDRAQWAYHLNSAITADALTESLGGLAGARITCLVLQGVKQALTDIGMALLRGLPLTRLDLQGCSCITDAGLGTISMAPKNANGPSQTIPLNHNKSHTTQSRRTLTCITVRNAFWGPW